METRSPVLDEIARGHSLPSADAAEMKDCMLRLGNVQWLDNENRDCGADIESGRDGHAAFGLGNR